MYIFRKSCGDYRLESPQNQEVAAFTRYTDAPHTDSTPLTPRIEHSTAGLPLNWHCQEFSAPQIYRKLKSDENEPGK
jgi:hypothetical protein